MPWVMAHSPVTSTKARPNSARMAALHRAAELVRQGLLAVADAEHRQAACSKTVGRGAGLAPSVTLAGPPERMMPFGAKARIRVSDRR